MPILKPSPVAGKLEHCEKPFLGGKQLVGPKPTASHTVVECFNLDRQSLHIVCMIFLHPP